jgi:very-short-patch-repair endonuclease
MHNNKYLKDRRKQLKNNLTPPEARLWSVIKGKQLNGFKFRRQHSINNYLVDFFCPSVNLVIEVDGKTHLEPTIAQNDRMRDELLYNIGIKVLRFTNIEIMNQLDFVLAEIKDNLPGQES